MRRLTRVALASVVMTAAMGFSTTARAQVVVLTAKSAGVLMKDAKTLISGASMDPNAAKPLLGMIEQFEMPGALPGVDLTKPVGAFLDLPKAPGPLPFTVVVFVPVTDYAAFMQMLPNFGFMVDPKSNTPGFSHTVTAPGGVPIPLLATNASGYAYFTTDPSTLSAIKAMKPATLLPKRPGAGDLSLTVNMDRIPDEQKQMFLADAPARPSAAQKEQKPGEDDATYKGRLIGIDASEKLFQTLVKDGREVSLDLGVDAAKGELAMEFGMSAKPSSTLAASFKKLGAMKSKFRGLGAGSMLTASAAVPMGESVRKLLNTGMEEAMKSAEKKGEDQKAMASRMIETLKPTLNADSMDMAMAIQGPFPGKSGGDPTVAMVFAFAVKGGKKMETAMLDSLKTAKPAEKAKVTLNVAKAADGTTIHRIKGDPDPKAAQFGDPNAFLAFREDTLFAAFGENGLDVLKKAMDAPKRRPRP